MSNKFYRGLTLSTTDLLVVGMGFHHDEGSNTHLFERIVQLTKDEPNKLAEIMQRANVQRNVSEFDRNKILGKHGLEIRDGAVRKLQTVKR